MTTKASACEAVSPGFGGDIHPLDDEGRREAFRAALLEWFDDHRRELPWRGVDDPYAVWVSEVMLQQTRVETVADYFERWMKRFPSVEALASAELEEVLEMWSGLGYYRRARYLHRAAGQLVEEGDGTVPGTVEELKKLPGIGPYTAGAVASIAFGKREALVDGNVMRVMTRLFTIGGKPRRSPAKQQIWERAGQLVDPNRPGDFNQAMMELGSQVCTTSGPECLSCPVRSWCAAREKGEPEEYPHDRQRPDIKPMRARCCVVFRQGEGELEFLLSRRPEDGLLGGLWEFPGCETDGEQWPGVHELARQIAQGPPGVDQQAVHSALEEPLGSVTHVFSHRRLQVRVHQLDAGRLHEGPAGARDHPGWRWVREGQINQVASAALLQKVERLWRAHR